MKSFQLPGGKEIRKAGFLQLLRRSFREETNTVRLSSAGASVQSRNSKLGAFFNPRKSKVLPTGSFSLLLAEGEKKKIVFLT